MKAKKGQRKSTKAQNPSWVRASISFPSDLYETLDEIAKQKKVSLAWVVRDAAEKYVAELQPSIRGAITKTRQTG
jgi:metal-responsive CopG/Arc/MetJ family transcriptional regulator